MAGGHDTGIDEAVPSIAILPERYLREACLLPRVLVYFLVYPKLTHTFYDVSRL